MCLVILLFRFSLDFRQLNTTVYLLACKPSKLDSSRNFRECFRLGPGGT